VCVGPRCNDRVLHGKGLDWDFQRSNPENLIYYNKYWGWEWYVDGGFFLCYVSRVLGSEVWWSSVCVCAATLRASVTLG
jgi:hypothetical protein